MKFPVWQTVRVGHINNETYRFRLHAVGVKMCKWASHMLENAPMYPFDRDFNLVKLDVRKELGIRPNTPYGEICRVAETQGLELCHPETALALRFFYLDQPVNEWLRVAMPPIKVSKNHDPGIFRVDHGPAGEYGEGLWLHASHGGSERTWVPENSESDHGAIWVFTQPGR
jgi:hypothetical protein